MFNVNQITSQLARMPDQALQQYAMMHKNDPYTVSLALAESNRRKDMRAGAAPMPGQMPKVVDQDIAQMAAVDPMGNFTGVLPENTGIGRLPAKNMQGIGKAEGGIVGYAGDTDGSYVMQKGYQYSPNQIQLLNPDGTPMTAEQLNALPEAQRIAIAKQMREQTGRGQAPKGYPGITYAPYGNAPQTLTPSQSSLAALYEKQRQQGQTALGKNPQTSLTVGEGVSGIDLGGPGAYPGTGGGAAPVAQAAPISPNATTSTSTSTPAPAPSGATTTSPLIKKPQGLGTLPAGFPSVNAAANDLMGLKNLLPAKEELPSTEDVENKMASFSAPAFRKAQDFIDKQKSQLKTDKEQDFYMALIEGGLAAASEAGPNAIQNIAKGFSKGAGSYATALKDLRKAAQENSKMEVDLARAEAEDKKGNYKAALELQEKAKDRNAKRDDVLTSGLFSLTGSMTHANAIIQSALISERSHAATAGASSPLTLYSTLGGGDVEKGLKKYTDITGGYHGVTAVENMRKHITDELLKLPEYKFDPTKLKIEAQRQLDEQLKRFPNLAQYASVPGPGNATPGLRYNPLTGKIE